MLVTIPQCQHPSSSLGTVARPACGSATSPANTATSAGPFGLENTEDSSTRGQEVV